MYIQGKFLDDISFDLIESMPCANDSSINDIIDALDELAGIWKVDGDFNQKAFELLSADNTMSKQTIRDTLSYLPLILNKAAIEKRLKSELGQIESMDSFVAQVNSSFKLLHAPLGKVLHVTAGNVFLGAIDSLVMGLITKNTNIVKIGSRNNQFPKLFCESLNSLSKPKVLTDHICFIQWRGGDKEFEKRICKYSDAVIIWGGVEVIKSYRAIAGVDTKLIEFGPKLSFGVLDNMYFQKFEESVLKGICNDVLTWNQSACSNAQTYFIQQDIDINQFLAKLYNVFLNHNNKQLFIDANAQVERLKEMQRVSFSNFTTETKSFYNKDFIISYKDNSSFDLSILNQTLNIKTFKSHDDLISMIKDMKFYFQTCGYGILKSRQSLMMTLAKCGLKRFTDIGHMTSGTEGAPHDGQFPLRSLVHEIADESISNQQLNYKLLKDRMPIFNEDNFEFINSDIIKSHQISKSKSLLSETTSKGLYFTSGGSTGSPKYSFYSYADLNRVAFKLSENFKSLGLSEKDTVANLFMAGNLWSSFLSTQKVLENIGCNTLPIGGASEDSLTVQYLVDFNATAIAGIPTKILALARYIEDNYISITLNTIFYAGERFSAESLKAVVSAFNCTNIRSAGFATVDCGLIGIQTLECSQDEHILLDEVNVYSKNDMQYISSSLRENMPVIDYQLDDKLIFDETNPRKFKLTGRTDKLIQIWGCRFTDSEILKATAQNSENIQIRLTKEERIVIISSQFAIAPEKFTQSFLCTSLDVRNTVNKDFLLSNISFEVGALNTNLKTGKTPLVIDERF